MLDEEIHGGHATQVALVHHVVGARLVLGLLAREAGEKLHNGTENVYGQDAAVVKVAAHPLAKRGVDDGMEDRRGDEVLLVLVKVLGDLLGALDLRQTHDANRAVGELRGSRQHDVVRGVSERV